MNLPRLPDLLESLARVRVMVAGVKKGDRRAINFTSSDASVIITAVDDGLNEKVDVNLAASASAWVSYTPAITQVGSVTATITYAKYSQIGKNVLAQAALAVTGTGTTNNVIQITLPVTAASSAGAVIGTAYIYDDSAFQAYVGAARKISTTAMDIIRYGVLFPLGQDPNFALTSPDAVTFSIMYEAA